MRSNMNLDPSDRLALAIRIGISLAILYLCLSCADMQQAHFFVQGNCEECKQLIEAYAAQLKGVESATWNYEQSQLHIQYNARATSVDEVQQAIAEQGYETQFFPANPEAKVQLPACCQESINRQLAPTTSGHSLPTH